MASEETKRKISIGRKLWLAKNPDKHPWKNPDKANSPPCENVKRLLILKGIDFIPEFSPGVEGRFFSVDIAFPDRQVIWEINGNQHYEKDGSLKPYYQERHNLLVADGWTVYEIPSKYCFNEEKIAEFIYLSFNSAIKIDFDYFSYSAPAKKYGKDSCPNCDGLKSQWGKQCADCYSKERKIKQDLKWPTVEEMKVLVYSHPTVFIAKTIGVSDVAVSKFCKKNGIEKPSRGYWMKQRAKENGTANRI